MGYLQKIQHSKIPILPINLPSPPHQRPLVLNHPNPLISNLSSLTLPNNPPRRLKRNWPRDLLNQ
ncbi:Uncharacterized protein FWK35_00017380 [Aphis craccivora]|uniref:Uncharacterized protein n=1 Tax=Aphis craccivora TaxID=307492 RepID=A0A6G0YP01_APHCR|nr:Uncharacterized protein FWK35_00017380 [Aphis craccivora]